jgi:L-threonylcarbamoyladenylate synthase
MAIISPMVDIQEGSHGIDCAADCIRGGGVAVLPTETVYGLFGRTSDASAIAHIYALKGRPNNNPLIAHVLDQASAKTLAAEWPKSADALCDAFWPGPLTIVVPRHPSVLSQAVGGFNSIAIRSPQHPITRAVLAVVGEPLSGPSANRSGNVSPTCAAHVKHDYRDVNEAKNLIVLDGGPCETGLESTVIDLTGDYPAIVRAGSVSHQALEGVLGTGIQNTMPVNQIASPGTRTRHYATHTPLELIEQVDLPTQLSTQAAVCVIGPAGLTVQHPHQHLEFPSIPKEAARVLYDLLRQADATDSTRILIVCPPNTTPWQPINDRLARASAPHE